MDLRDPHEPDQGNGKVLFVYLVLIAASVVLAAVFAELIRNITGLP